ncbi:MAG TPA: hypothetical protein VGG89_10020 [Candidatus Baltobacteraceae bacterium]
MAVPWKPLMVMLVAVQAMAGCTVSRNTGEGAALIGTWSCSSVSHTVSTMRFSRASDGSISMANRYTTEGGDAGEFDETYSYDPKGKIWTWSTTDSITGSREEGTAGPWTGRTWTFDGTRYMRSGSKQKMQMVYTRLNDNAFRREFMISRRETPIMTSSSLCKRI